MSLKRRFLALSTILSFSLHSLALRAEVGIPNEVTTPTLPNAAGEAIAGDELPEGITQEQIIEAERMELPVQEEEFSETPGDDQGEESFVKEKHLTKQYQQQQQRQDLGFSLKKPHLPKFIHLKEGVEVKDINIRVAGNHVFDKCAHTPQVVHAGDHIYFDILLDGRGIFKYEILVSRNGFRRHKKEVSFFAKEFDRKSGHVRVGHPFLPLHLKRRLRVRYKVRNIINNRTEGMLTAYVAVKRYGKDVVVKPIQIPVVKKVLLKRDHSKENNCAISYSPEVISGIYSANTDTPMEINLSQAIEQLEAEKRSKSKSWIFSPILGVGFYGVGVAFGLGGFMKSKMKEIMYQQSETVQIATNSVLEPGDKGFIYKQLTKHREGFGVYTVNHCGVESYVGNVYHDRYSTAMGVALVNPTAGQDGRPEQQQQQQQQTQQRQQRQQMLSHDYAKGEFNSSEYFDVEFGGPTYNTCKELDGILGARSREGQAFETTVDYEIGKDGKIVEDEDEE